MKVARWQLDQRRAQPLEVKILMSKQRIWQWYEHWGGEVYVAFSGGLDSTVLLHLVRSMYPDTPAVFFNTGLEYPEIVKFVKGHEGVRLQKGKKRFQQVVEEYGYPVISKKVSRYVADIRNLRPGYTVTLRLTGKTRNGEYRPAYMLARKWRFLLDAPFKISDRCCYWMKKAPAAQAERELGPPMLGILCCESDQRTAAYLHKGCNAFVSKRPTSWPLAFWTREDIWQYVHKFSIPYCELYNQGCTSTGCFACMFGVHLEKEPNRFQRMLHTHPKLYHYCMDKLGLAEVLDYIGVPYKDPPQMRLF